MWRHVEIVLTDVSEDRIASIFKVEDKKKSASEPAEQVQYSFIALIQAPKSLQQHTKTH
jgi:hypothetical protein